MAVFTETIQLNDQVSAAAKAASGAVAGLGSSTESAQGALAKATTMTAPAGAAMKSLGQSTFDASNAMKVGKETIGTAIAGIKSAFTSLSQGDVKGAIQGVTDAVAGIAKMLDLVVPGLGQAVSTVVQIAGGLAGITAGLIQSGIEFAISSSESKQAMLSLFDAMGGGVVKGEEVEGVIDGLKAKFGIAKDSLIGYTNALMAMGRTDLSQLEDDLLAVSSAAALVKGGDQALLGFIKKIDMAAESGGKLKLATKQLANLSATGANVGDVAKVMGVSVENLTKDLAAGTVDAKKFGDALQQAIIKKGQGPLERMATSSANLKKILSEAWGDLFEDIDVGPFMKEVKELFDIFGQGKSSGQALKAGIGGFFKEVFATLTKVVPMVKHFMLDLIIYGLRAYIAIKPIVAKIKEFVQSERGMKIINAALQGMWFVLKVVGAALLVAVAVVGLFFAALIALSIAAYTVVGSILSFVSETGTALSDWVTKAPQAALDFVTGLVKGITDGAGAVIGAVTGLADGATGAFKNALGIASPSKVGHMLGKNFGESTGDGIEDSQDSVHGASTGVAAAAVKGVTSGGDTGQASGAKSGSSMVVYVTVEGASKSVLEISQEMWSQVIQRTALESGL